VRSGDEIKAVGTWSRWLGPQTRGSHRVDDLAGLAIALPADTKRANLEVQIGYGPWQTVAIVDGKRLREKGHASESGTDWKVIVENVYHVAKDGGKTKLLGQDSNLVLVVDYPRADVQVRISIMREWDVADPFVKRLGRLWFPRLAHSDSPDDVDKFRVSVQEQIDLSGDCTFVLQTRPYGKFEFPNVALSPIPDAGAK
jgi:hypothetical protein